MKTWIVVFILFFVTVNISHAGFCLNKLSMRSTHVSNATQAFVSYLSMLVENRIIGIAELSYMIEHSSPGQLVSPFTKEHSITKSPALVHSEEIARQMRGDRLDKQAVLQWAKDFIEDKVRIGNVRETTKADTAPLSFGQFRKVLGTVRNLEMMVTPVTQKQWVQVMGENPSTSKYGTSAIEIRTKEKIISLKPDHPVENITWWSALEFANRVSLNAGLDPVYDFRGVNFKKDTRAEDGTLTSSNGGGFDYDKFALMDGEGYRLPTGQELTYALTTARARGNKPFEDAERHLYAWGFPNSHSSTHPVGKLSPLTIFNEPFFDLFGNVSVFTSSNEGTFYPDIVVRGGDYLTYFDKMVNKGTVLLNSRSSFVGLRLVRTGQ